MQRVSSGAKRIRDLDNLDDLPASKKQKTRGDLGSDALSLWEFTNLADAEVAQGCINAREKILKLLCENPDSLDVSWLSPETLAALPSGAPNSTLEPLSWTVLRDCEPSMFATYADLLAELLKAAQSEKHFGSVDFTDWLLMNLPSTDEALIAPLLFPDGDRATYLGILQQQGDLLLAERLTKLTNPARPDDTLEIDLLFRNTEEW